MRAESLHCRFRSVPVIANPRNTTLKMEFEFIALLSHQSLSTKRFKIHVICIFGLVTQSNCRLSNCITVASIEKTPVQSYQDIFGAQVHCGSPGRQRQFYRDREQIGLREQSQAPSGGPSSLRCRQSTQRFPPPPQGREQNPPKEQQLMGGKDKPMARFNGLSKIHKVDVSLRPIVVFNNTPTYDLAKWMSKALCQRIVLRGISSAISFRFSSPRCTLFSGSRAKAAIIPRNFLTSVFHR